MTSYIKGFFKHQIDPFILQVEDIVFCYQLVPKEYVIKNSEIIIPMSIIVNLIISGYSK